MKSSNSVFIFLGLRCLESVLKWINYRALGSSRPEEPLF